MTWAGRLKRVFAIEITTCGRYGGRLRVIASIEGATVIERILDHLREREDSGTACDPAHSSRGPPSLLPI